MVRCREWVRVFRKGEEWGMGNIRVESREKELRGLRKMHRWWVESVIGIGGDLQSVEGWWLKVI